MSDEHGRLWLAYYPDWSGMALFNSEVEALRYAVEHSMQVAAVSPGQMFGPGMDPKGGLPMPEKEA